MCECLKKTVRLPFALPSMPPLSKDLPLPEQAPLSWRQRLSDWLYHFVPTPIGINGRERLRVTAGIGLGILLAALLARWWSHGDTGPQPWMVASLGASAVLVFATPSSPLSQPWPVLAGSTLSVLVGLACAALVPYPAFAAALAVALSVAMMVPLRCLHPPGAAVALFAVLNYEHGVQLAALPILVNAVVLLLFGIAYNTLTGRSYPHRQRPAPVTPASSPSRFISSDLDAALSHYNEVLDISRADLEGLLHLAGRAAFQRTLGELRCSDIMSAPALSVEATVALQDAWSLMRREQIKALPVTDGQKHVVGIVTVADFMRLANLDLHDGLGKRLRALVMGRGTSPKVVQDIMSNPVQIAQAGQHAMDLVPLFSHGGHHHIPIVQGDGVLVGIITQTDLVKALAATIHIPQS